MLVELGYLFMDDLSRALAPFYPASGGGGFNPPPAPEGDSSLFPLFGANEYQHQPGPSENSWPSSAVELGREQEVGESQPNISTLDLTNDRDPRVIKVKLLKLSKGEVQAQKEELAALITPLIEEHATAFPSINNLPTKMEMVELIIDDGASTKAKEGNLPSASHQDLANLKKFLTRARKSALGEGGQMDIPGQIKRILGSLATREN